MTQYIYTGECSDCGTEHRREWRSEWRGPDGETSYAADCRVCGPGHEIHMSPELPENETIEVWSSDPRLNGTTLVVSTTPEPDSFELVVADCLPDDDDGGEEPGVMFKRALAKAKARIDLIRKVAIPIAGAEELDIDPAEEAISNEAWEQVSFEERDRDEDLTVLHDALNERTMQLVDEYGPDLSGIDEGMVEVPVSALREILRRARS